MVYYYVAELLRKVIEKKEAPFINSTTKYYLVGSLYWSTKLEELFLEYLKTKNERYYLQLFECSNTVCLSFFRIFENKNLAQEEVFQIETLMEQSDILANKMIYIRNNEFTLDEFQKLNNYLIKNIKELIIKNNDSELSPYGSDCYPEVISWWNSLSRKGANNA